jgi:hypothetical protein
LGFRRFGHVRVALDRHEVLQFQMLANTMNQSRNITADAIIIATLCFSPFPSRTAPIISPISGKRMAQIQPTATVPLWSVGIGSVGIDFVASLTVILLVGGDCAGTAGARIGSLYSDPLGVALDRDEVPQPVDDITRILG